MNLRGHPFKYRQQALTMIETVVIILVLCLLVILLLPIINKGRSKSSRMSCVGRLKSIGLSFRTFSTDNADRFPTQLSTNEDGSTKFFPPAETFRYFQSLSNELNTPQILVCPSDTRKAAPRFSELRNENISYFLGLTADETMPTSLLAGDRNLTTNGVAVSASIIELTTNSIVGSTKAMHVSQGDIAMGDGSVQQFTAARFQAWLESSERPSPLPARLAVP